MEVHLGFCPLDRLFVFANKTEVHLGFVIHDFGADRKSTILGADGKSTILGADRKSTMLGGWGGPGGLENHSRRWGAKPRIFGMVFGADGAAHTPNNQRFPAGPNYVLKTQV